MCVFVCICLCVFMCVSVSVYVCGGLLHAGDRVVEVNGFPVDGMEPEQVIQIVVRTACQDLSQNSPLPVFLLTLIFSIPPNNQTASSLAGHHHVQGCAHHRAASSQQYHGKHAAPPTSCCPWKPRPLTVCRLYSCMCGPWPTTAPCGTLQFPAPTLV